MNKNEYRIGKRHGIQDMLDSIFGRIQNLLIEKRTQDTLELRARVEELEALHEQYKPFGIVD